MKTTNLGMSSLLMSLGEIVLGILLLINPIGFTSGIIIVLGICIMIMGISQVIGYFRTDAEDAAKSGKLSKGILFVLIGGFFAFKSAWLIATIPVITMLYGVLTLVTGVGKLQQSIDMARLKRKYWFVVLISAILALVFSLMIIVNPFASTAVLWSFTGISLIVEAVIDIVTFIFNQKN